jgi:L,D-peptidoglycan transpeptidase YkuD (ErfK/YbiS/YcfS/YnhG family)
MGWCDDPNSSYYNKLVKLPFTHKHEKLYKKENIYDIILVLNYNMNPVKKNKGSALFIHVSKINYKKTEGCVAIKKLNLIKLLKMINPNTRVKIFHRK